MVELIGLVLGLTGEAEAKLAVSAAVGLGEDDAAVGLAPPQGGELLQGLGGQGIG